MSAKTTRASVHGAKSFRQALNTMAENPASLALLMQQYGDTRPLPTIYRSMREMASGESPVSSEMMVLLAVLKRSPLTTRRFGQWEVTDYGLEACDGKYSIAADTLHRLRSGTDLYSLPMHMAEKNWVNLPDFLSAFQAALALHQPVLYDLDRMARSRLAAERVRREGEAFEQRLGTRTSYTVKDLLAAM
ncbi:hypothetical protein EAH89_29570 [Roseomonas nepalensis]|uniref:Uncharacterized protein n=1 Tax=Muricoccus nepalensis TaxID=1854500 RepID=A0A502EKT3_9PROT|nr:hypothetical protein [Roseomonas nepalensis]TPG38057.1 hypothetical protein EAH89_29570 [Roseomonas nepalensis]